MMMTMMMMMMVMMVMMMMMMMMTTMMMMMVMMMMVSRYDHFAVLCELLPAGLPSLAVNLLATSHGYFNDSLTGKLYKGLQCVDTPKYKTGSLDLANDRF